MVVAFIRTATAPVIGIRQIVFGMNLLARGRAHRYKLKDGVRRRLDVRRRVHDLHETSHLILGEKFDAIFFSVGIKDVGETPNREGRDAFRVVITLRVPTKDVMKLLLDVDDGLTMSTEVLHDYSFQRRVTSKERRDTMTYQIIHDDVLRPQVRHNHKPATKHGWVFCNSESESAD